MSMDAIINLEEALGRKFTEQESARLREIGRQLHLRDDDALWSLLAALEYQRIFEGVDKLMTSRHLCAIRLHERKTAMP